MGFDFNRFKQNVSKFVDDASKKVRQYAPESFSKEKKFVNAIVASMALMVMADKKVETEEVTQSLEIINEIVEIQELNMTKEAIELFEHHIETLSDVLESPAKFAIKEATILQDIARIKPYPEYVPMIENLLQILAEADGNVDKSELNMKHKIVSMLK